MTLDSVYTRDQTGVTDAFHESYPLTTNYHCVSMPLRDVPALGTVHTLHLSRCGNVTAGILHHVTSALDSPLPDYHTRLCKHSRL